MSPIFDFEDYKSFLRAWIKAQPHRGHGSKAIIARAAGCQTAYISQIVLGNAHLSLEQAERLATHFQFTEEETQFFFLLVQKDRAGTEPLRRHFLKQIKRAQKHRTQLKNRIDVKENLTQETQSTYFSSWAYAAIHMLTTIPSFQTRDAITKRLKLPSSTVDEILVFLQSAQLIRKDSDRFITNNAQMHLPHDSPLIARHHTNWRLQTIRSLETKNDRSLHYSSCISISERDAELIREQLLKLIESTKKTIKESLEEEIYSFCLDFFQV